MLRAVAFARAALNTKPRAAGLLTHRRGTGKELLHSHGKTLRETGVIGGKTTGDIYALGTGHAVIASGTVDFVRPVE